MEILSENVLYGGYIFAMAVVIAITLLTSYVAILAIIDVARYRRDSDAKSVLITFGVIAAAFIFITISGIAAGPDVEYPAIVKDYNEVYEQGYVVDRQEGKLSILTKEGGR